MNDRRTLAVIPLHTERELRVTIEWQHPLEPLIELREHHEDNRDHCWGPTHDGLQLYASAAAELVKALRKIPLKQTGEITNG